MSRMPRRVKHRKSQRRRIRGNATRGNTVELGEYGLQTTQAGYIKAATIEAGRIAAQQYVRGIGRLFIRIFPQKSVTSTPLETRMGKGKGEVDYWAAVVKPGTVLYELSGVTEEQARICLARVAHKMPVRCRFVRKRPDLTTAAGDA
ncbi:50S ribosomal protein L16 [Blastopirellula sp. J2-11]|uniref:50S ribosomal protein L16 n=1 Tax=Blastopirellula sp. J2-11 TaxID=2943192 RepID=UPI0021C5E7F6|nr:50S ribosomal protein L16 [Blastopirellula sp. J2-11]UUO05999.1 50S ribosomal protein L16 [Blastopirellula sp. J2-11]